VEVNLKTEIQSFPEEAGRRIKEQVLPTMDLEVKTVADWQVRSETGNQGVVSPGAWKEKKDIMSENKNQKAKININII